MRGGKLQGGKAKLKAIENEQSESEISGLESGPERAKYMLAYMPQMRCSSVGQPRPKAQSF
jgi:hypothetical protein